LQNDPIGYAGGLNLYAYGENDPINLRDPSGLEADDIGEIVVTGKRTKKQDSGGGDYFGFFWGLGNYVSPAFNIFSGAAGGGGGGEAGEPNDPKADDKKCSTPKLTPAERAAAKAGDRRAFWSSRAQRGDPLGPTALSIVNNVGLGAAANGKLGWAILQRSPNIGAFGARFEITRIGTTLMQQHVAAIDRVGSPTAEQIAEYHFDVFKDAGLPASTFGGSPMTGTTTEASMTAFIWLNC
jgi:uncharacterized protein RhaS with RHS repeats